MLGNCIEDIQQYVLELEARLSGLELLNASLAFDNQRLLGDLEQYSKAFHNSNAWLVISRVSDWAYLDVNNAFANSLGFTREQLIGRRSCDLNIWVDHEELKHLLDSIREHGFIKDFQFRFRRNSGEVGYALTSMNKIEINGEDYLLTSGIDITKQKIAEEMFTKAFYDNQTAMSIVSIEDNTYLDVNEAYSTLTGYSREELIGRFSFDLVVSTLDSNVIGEKYNELINHGRVQGFEHRYRKKNGDIGYIITAHAMVNINGKPCRLGSGVDITEHKQSQADLSKSRNHFRQLFNSIPMAVLISTVKDGTIVEANDTFLNKCGMPRAQVIGQMGFFQNSLSSPDDADRYLDLFREQGIVNNYEMEFHSPTGDTRTVLLSGAAIDWEGQDCILSISNDITRFRQYQNELFRLDSLNLMGQMAGSIAHEIRNPLTSIKGFLQLFRQEYKYREDGESIDLMIDEIDRVNNIISGFLSLAKMSSINLHLSNLNDCIVGILPLINADALTNDVSVNSRFDPIPSSMLDESEIRQLLLNLARNAIQAMPEGGVLSISTFSDEDGVNLVVQDQGKGIPPEIMAKIGTPFFTTKEGGSGLGLNVCYSIAERHNARISIDTSSQGTSFKVTFPEPI